MEISEEQLEELIKNAVEAKTASIRAELEAIVEQQRDTERMRMLGTGAADEYERVAVDSGTGYQYATIELAKIQFNPLSTRTPEDLDPTTEENLNLAKDIREYGGLLRPLLVYRKDGGYVLVKGARRLAVLRGMGEESVHAYILPIKPPFAQEESWVNGY